MSDLNLDQPILPLPSLQGTPPQGTESEDVLPAAEVVEPVKKTRKKSVKRTPPQVSIDFVSEEDQRSLDRANRLVMKRLGIKKNNSYIV